MKRVALSNGAGPRGVPAPISAPTRPKVPKSTRVGDGVSKRMADSLENLITGLGTSQDKTTATRFTYAEIPKDQLEAAYRQDWISGKVVDIPAADATREWRNWQSDKKDIEDIEILETNLGIQKKTYHALLKARLYGGAGLILGVNQGNMQDELDATKVGKDSLKFVHVVTRHELVGAEIEWNIDSPYYGMPKYYRRANDPKQQQIHPSRVVRFVGREVPDPTINTTNGWGDSTLQVVNDAVLTAGLAIASGSQMLQEMKMDVIKIPELSDLLSNKEYERRLLARFGAAAVAKSLYNILLLDKEEEWERIELQMAGMPDVLKVYLLIASAAADIPATRMLSQSPTGLTATGESDIRNYYDKVKSEQITVITPAMEKLNEILIRSALGTNVPGDIIFAWRPLWQMDDVQKATVAKSKADTWKIDVDAGLIPPEVMRDARINQLIEDGTYPGLEQILDDYGPLEDIEEEIEEEVQLLGPDGEPLEVDPNQTPTPPANENQRPKKAVGDMADRIRTAMLDGTRKKKSRTRRGRRAGYDEADAYNPNQPRDPGGEGGGQWVGNYQMITQPNGRVDVVSKTGEEIGSISKNGNSYNAWHKPTGKMLSHVQNKVANTHEALIGREGRTRIRFYGSQKKAFRALTEYHENWKSSRRDSLGDRKVDTLYVRRDVINAKEILAHYAKQGVPDLFDAKELHVTICYSRTPVDWTKTGEAWNQNEDGTLTIKEGGMRTMEKYGNNSLVLLFNSNELQWRHADLIYRAEASWDYDGYSPHITIAEMSDLSYKWNELEPYTGEIKLGVEIFEPTKTEGKYA